MGKTLLFLLFIFAVILMYYPGNAIGLETSQATQDTEYSAEEDCDNSRQESEYRTSELLNAYKSEYLESEYPLVMKLREEIKWDSLYSLRLVEHILHFSKDRETALTTVISNLKNQMTLSGKTTASKNDALDIIDKNVPSHIKPKLKEYIKQMSSSASAELILLEEGN